MKFLSLSLFLNIGFKILNFSEIFLIGSSRIEFIYVKIFSYEISMYTIDTRDFICLIVILLYTTNVFTFNRIVLDNPEGYSNFRPVYDGYGIIIFKTSQAVYRLPCQTSCVTASIIITRDPPPTRKRITKII